MKYRKKVIIITGMIWISLLSFVACGTEKKSEQSIAEKITIQEAESASSAVIKMEEVKTEITEFLDYETLGIKEYEYSSEFYMGDNLKTAITQLALSYDNFDKDSVVSENWKEIFVMKFIQNTRVSFDYLDIVSEKNDGQISIEELNYIQYSLTGIELDVSSYTGGSVNRYDAASSWNYGVISEYEYMDTDNGVIVTADFEIGFDGTDSMQKRKITVNLIKNSYSCFDGYSVVSFSSKVITSSDELENIIGEYEYVLDYESETLCFSLSF